jgi:serine/threonine protein kinase
MKEETQTDPYEELGRSEATTKPAEAGQEEAKDRWVGSYRLIRRLGAGGMGEVWSAEQASPLRRQVAIKFIRGEFVNNRELARFEVERQALALMNHPNVAGVFDAGVTEDGRPYFVMEYVRGVAITEHCDVHRMRVRERLELFLKVCDGVVHAHQRGLIHRDLKPSNVLVEFLDGVAVPKIIDFGVAKPSDRHWPDRTALTEIGTLLGTPEYMSPEQAGATPQDVDVRADVYSLGVMLYELLSGTLPLDGQALRRAGYDARASTLRLLAPRRTHGRATRSANPFNAS